jgi:hypothetical protein
MTGFTKKEERMLLGIITAAERRWYDRGFLDGIRAGKDLVIQSLGDGVVKKDVTKDLMDRIARLRAANDMLAMDLEQHLRCSRCGQSAAEMKVAPKRIDGQ